MKGEGKKERKTVEEIRNRLRRPTAVVGETGLGWGGWLVLKGRHGFLTLPSVFHPRTQADLMSMK
jgi:hypothetical protein